MENNPPLQQPTTVQVDEQLLRRINRQLRVIKALLAFFFFMMLASVAILGFIAYKVMTFTSSVNTKINNIENTTTQKLDVKSQLCENATSTIAKQFCQ